MSLIDEKLASRPCIKLVPSRPATVDKIIRNENVASRIARSKSTTLRDALENGNHIKQDDQVYLKYLNSIPKIATSLCPDIIPVHPVDMHLSKYRIPTNPILQTPVAVVNQKRTDSTSDTLSTLKDVATRSFR